MLYFTTRQINGVSLKNLEITSRFGARGSEGFIPKVTDEYISFHVTCENESSPKMKLGYKKLSQDFHTENIFLVFNNCVKIGTLTKVYVTSL